MVWKYGTEQDFPTNTNVKGFIIEKVKEVPRTYQWRSHTQSQNFKKLIYSMYIIYILKNVACKN